MTSDSADVRRGMLDRAQVFVKTMTKVMGNCTNRKQSIMFIDSIFSELEIIKGVQSCLYHEDHDDLERILSERYALCQESMRNDDVVRCYRDGFRGEEVYHNNQGVVQEVGAVLLMCCENGRAPELVFSQESGISGFLQQCIWEIVCEKDTKAWQELMTPLPKICRDLIMPETAISKDIECNPSIEQEKGIA